ncbi:myc box-dependent-interacting protein 1 [Aplochiton taeniatus]
MAELNLGKGLTAGKVASNVQKKLTRAQEKVLQKLGKADETRDIAFEEGVINFNKQYMEGSKLQRDLRVYLEAVKAMHESSKNLQSCLVDMYEPEWDGHEEVESIAEDCDVLWTDYHQKLVSNSLISMDTYLGQFPDIKSRIAKRDRKLVDYDSARHNYSSTHKSKDKKGGGGIKITKPASLLERATPGWAQGILSAHNVAQSNLSRNQAEDELERAQKVFEEINVDLQEELPSLWNSRVGFYVSTFQSLAGFEEKFHKEMGRLDQDLHGVLVNLETNDSTTSKTGNRGAGSRNPRSGRDDTNHTLRPGGPPPIPKSPSKLRPAMPPPPKVTPSRDMKPENILNLFDAASAPDISITSPTQFDSPAGATLLDVGVSSAAAQPADWDSWVSFMVLIVIFILLLILLLNDPATELAAVGSYASLIPKHDAWVILWFYGTPFQPRGTDRRACSSPGAFPPLESGGRPEDGPAPEKEPEPEAEGWDDDGTLPVRYDPLAAAQEGWGDDGSLPVKVVPDLDLPAPTAQAPPEASEEPEATWEEEPQGDTTPAAVETPTATEETPVVAAAESTDGAPAAEDVEMPPGFLFKVQVMHDYTANDSDELEMKAGEVVLVVTFDNPEEQDDGWLMGMTQSEWVGKKENAPKGVFPENFTQRL